jgi:flagellin
MPTISTNTAANSALRYLNYNSETASESVAKLASGSRITKASDDAAGLAIGTRIKSDVTVLEQASTNASHASSVLQTADGGAARVADILQRMKSLAAESLSGSVSDSERAYIQAEFTQLQSEIDGIASGTRFNGDSLLDGTSQYGTGVSFLVGTDVTSDSITVTIADLTAATLGVDAATINVSTQVGAQTAAAAIDTAIDSVSTARANLGALMSRFDYRGQMIDTTIENLDAAESVIMDADIAKEQTNMTTADVLSQAGISALGKANEMAQNLLQLFR